MFGCNDSIDRVLTALPLLRFDGVASGGLGSAGEEVDLDRLPLRSVSPSTVGEGSGTEFFLGILPQCR